MTEVAVAKESPKIKADLTKRKVSHGQGVTVGKTEYLPLLEHSLNDKDETCSFYAVLIDSNYPSFDKKAQKYKVSAKIVDPSVHEQSEHAYLNIWSKDLQGVPVCSKVGDIIRVHRGTIAEYRGKRQFNVNVGFKGSWALFATNWQEAQSAAVAVEEEEASERSDEEPEPKNSKYRPLKFSGKNYSFDS